MLDQTLHLRTSTHGEVQEDKEEVSELMLWISKAKQGDADAFAHIYDSAINDIYRYVYFKVAEEDASDVTSDIFIKVWEKLSSFQGDQEGKFRSWLFTIAHRTIIDYYRTKKITISLDDSLEVPDSEHTDIAAPEEELTHTLNTDLLKDALKKLAEPGKSVITMKYLEDLSYTEISKILKIKEGNIRIIVHRSLKRLQEIIDELRSDH
ncbi:MAG: RNA polymerase sigma factor [Candidatus Gracilibacteria bacterium]